MPFWDERFAHATSNHPELQAEQVLIDALAAASCCSRRGST